jgi:hypothetical protein
MLVQQPLGQCLRSVQSGNENLLSIGPIAIRR